MFAGLCGSIEFCCLGVYASFEMAERKVMDVKWDWRGWRVITLVILGVHHYLGVSETEQNIFPTFCSPLLLSFRVLRMWLHLYLKAWKKSFPLNQKSDPLEDLLAAHEHLSAQSNFLLGISGEEVLQPARQIRRRLWNTHGDKWVRADGRDSERGGFSTASNTTAKLRTVQKASFSHDLQTTRAPAYESMTEQCF